MSIVQNGKEANQRADLLTLAISLKHFQGVAHAYFSLPLTQLVLAPDISIMCMCCIFIHSCIFMYSHIHVFSKQEKAARAARTDVPPFQGALFTCLVYISESSSSSPPVHWPLGKPKPKTCGSRFKAPEPAGAEMRVEPRALAISSWCCVCHTVTGWHHGHRGARHRPWELSPSGGAGPVPFPPSLLLRPFSPRRTINGQWGTEKAGSA